MSQMNLDFLDLRMLLWFVCHGQKKEISG